MGFYYVLQYDMSGVISILIHSIYLFKTLKNIVFLIKAFKK